MKYFKIKTGYGEEEFVSIDETELEIAFFIFLNDSKAIFKSGVVRGKDIISIKEDWNAAMGWNKNHQLQPEDWADIRNKGVDALYTGAISNIKEKVQFLIETNQQHLIGKNVAKQLKQIYKNS